MKTKIYKCSNCVNEYEPLYHNGIKKSKLCIPCLSIKGKMIIDKERFSEMKINCKQPEYKKELQNNINLLSRMIDEKFGFDCIDCGNFLDKNKHQIDACHFISRKKNPTLRYHLDNLHSGHNHCNCYNEIHESNYKQGLINRYGELYLSHLNNLNVKYKEIHLSNVDVVEKLKLVRSIVRNFKTYQLTDSIQVRNLFNNLIGIYK